MFLILRLEHGPMKMTKLNPPRNVTVYTVYRRCGNNMDDRGGYNNEAFVC